MRMPWQRKKRALITEMRETPLENHNRRIRDYNWLQGLRVPLLLLAALFYLVWENVWIAAILSIISVPLPWIAVVVGNNVGERPDARRPKVYKPAVARQQAENARNQIASAQGMAGPAHSQPAELDTGRWELPAGRGPVIDAEPAPTAEPPKAGPPKAGPPKDGANVQDGPIVIDHEDIAHNPADNGRTGDTTDPGEKDAEND